MKTMQTLLAVTILSVAGAASAATVTNYTASSATTITGATSGSGSASGTASLDDSGVLTLLLDGTTVTGFTDTTNGSTATFNGTYSGGMFTASSGSSVITSCTNNGAIIDGCSSPSFAGVGGVSTFLTLNGSVDGTGGVINITASSNGASISTAYTLSGGTPVTPAVPLPAAAWLFGSGIMGLAGAARRRRNSQAA
jgi:hypothetical protein